MSNRGRELFQEGKWQEAAEVFEESTRAREQDREALSWLGMCYVHIGEHERAVRTFEKLAKPLPPLAALNWAAIHVKNRDFSEASRILAHTDRRLRKRSLDDMLEVDACFHLQDILSIVENRENELPPMTFDLRSRFLRTLSLAVLPALNAMDLAGGSQAESAGGLKGKVKKLGNALRQQCWMYGMSKEVDFLEDRLVLKNMEGYEESKQVYRDTFLTYLDHCLELKYSIKDFLISSIKPRDAHALYCLIRERRPGTVLEIGSFVGFSTSIMGQAIRKNGTGAIHCVDPNMDFFSVVNPLNHARNMLKKLELDEYVEMHEGFFSHPRSSDRPDIPVLGPQAPSFLPPVDLAFIDGDHEAVAVLQDFMLSLPCLGPEATLVFHDIKVWRGVKQALVTILQDVIWKEHMRYFQFTPEGFDGLGVIERRQS